MYDPVLIYLLVEMKSSHNPRDYKSKLYFISYIIITPFWDDFY